MNVDRVRPASDLRETAMYLERADRQLSTSDGRSMIPGVTVEEAGRNLVAVMERLCRELTAQISEERCDR